MYSRRPGGEALGYRRMAAVINISIQRCSGSSNRQVRSRTVVADSRTSLRPPVFSRSEKEQCRALLGSGPVSLPAPSAMPQPAATEGDFPPLQISQQHVKPTPPSEQHTPLPGGLYTPPRGDGKMRLPNSPETPTPMHVRAGPTRAGVTRTAPAVGTSAASTFSAMPPVGPALFVRPGNKASFVGGGGQGGVTSRPLSQPSQVTASAAAIGESKRRSGVICDSLTQDTRFRRSEEAASVCAAREALLPTTTTRSLQQRCGQIGVSCLDTAADDGDHGAHDNGPGVRLAGDAARVSNGGAPAGGESAR